MTKHMGRLALDENSIGRFAGSTTGVHFVTLIEQIVKSTHNLPTAFPEAVYQLQHLPIWDVHVPSLSGLRTYLTNSPYPDIFADMFSQPLLYYYKELDHFNEHWSHIFKKPDPTWSVPNLEQFQPLATCHNDCHVLLSKIWPFRSPKTQTCLRSPKRTIPRPIV